MFALITVHSFFVFVGTPWRLVLFDFVLVWPRASVGEMVLASCELTADFFNDHFALVLVLSVALYETIGLFIFAE